MSGEDKYQDGDPRTGHEPSSYTLRGHAEIMPREGGTPQPGEPTRPINVVYPPSAPGPGPGDGPRVVRVRRSVMVWLLCLFLVAVLAVVALVLLRPFKSTPVASQSTTSPSTSATSPSASPSASSASPSTSAGSSSSPGATSPAASASATTTSSSIPAGGGGLGAPIANLSALTALSSTDISNQSNGPEQIGSVTYQDSVGFTCDTYGNQANFVYDVAGYKFLTTVLGIPSDATNAAGNAMTVTFFKDGATQLGQAITISLDHPQSVHLNLQGASQLEIACNATDVTSHQPVYMDAAMGNATIGPS